LSFSNEKTPDGQFLPHQLARAGPAGAARAASARLTRRILGANDRFGFAVIGCGGMGTGTPSTSLVQA
jgi:hypothetical protein